MTTEELLTITDVQTGDGRYTPRVERTFCWRKGLLYVATHEYDDYDGIKNVKVTLIKIDDKKEAKKYIERLKLIEAL